MSRVCGAKAPRFCGQNAVSSFLGTAEMQFEISVTGAVPRHGVINSEEFGEKLWWVVVHSQ